MKVRILSNPDGTIQVIHPAPASQRQGESTADWLDRIFTKANPDALPFQDIEDTALPTRRFRNAWIPDVVAGTKPDLVKSKAIVMVELRRERDKDLDRTDKESARLNDVGNASEKKAIKDERQALRDLPAAAQTKLDLITDVVDLETQYPADLTIADFIAKAA